MTRYEYLRISVTLITYQIIHQYNLKNIFRNGFIYLEIIKGVYELSQAGRIKMIYSLNS